MKIKLTLLLSLALIIEAKAQQTELQLVSAAGETAKNALVEISYSIGEPFYTSNTNSTLMLTNGFIQVMNELKPDAINIVEEINVKIFPNPSSDFVTVEFGLEKSEYSLEIYSLEGKLLLTQNLEDTNLIDISMFSAGVYQFFINNRETNNFNHYKLIKK